MDENNHVSRHLRALREEEMENGWVSIENRAHRGTGGLSDILNSNK
jgi:hypothetical protein